MISFFIGMLCGLWLMYLLQINRDNKLKNRINKAIRYIKENYVHWGIEQDELLDILGGDVDDE